MTRVLIVEDEKKIARLVETYLEREGYRIFVAYDGEVALDIIGREQLDLIVLDLMLPGVSGYEICEYVRQKSTIPIIMLTAKTDEDQRVKGFNMGADDYVIKPFSPKELVARIKAVLRRSSKNESILSSDDQAVELNVDTHRTTVNSNNLQITPTEFRILETFLRNKQRVYSRSELAERAFGWDYESYEETIYVHVKNLRKKISQHTSKQYIHTVYGVGYRWDDDVK